MAQWHYQKNGEIHGPVSGKELKTLAESKQLDPSDLVRKVGTERWAKAKRVKGLFPELPSSDTFDGTNHEPESNTTEAANTGKQTKDEQHAVQKSQSFSNQTKLVAGLTAGSCGAFLILSFVGVIALVTLVFFGNVSMTASPIDRLAGVWKHVEVPGRWPPTKAEEIERVWEIEKVSLLNAKVTNVSAQTHIHYDIVFEHNGTFTMQGIHGEKPGVWEFEPNGNLRIQFSSIETMQRVTKMNQRTAAGPYLGSIYVFERQKR